MTGAAAYSYTQVNSYDALGRVTSQTQNFLNTGGTWTPYTSSRTYNLASNVLTQTYPSNRTATYGYNAAAQLTSFTGTLGDGSSRNYATGITYTPAGLMSRETFGMQASTLYHNLHYNNRLQLVDIRVGDSSTDEWTWNRGALVYYYGTTARDGWNAFANSADNNGNVLRQVNYAPLSGGGYEIPQLDDYNYDALNRKYVRDRSSAKQRRNLDVQPVHSEFRIRPLGQSNGQLLALPVACLVKRRTSFNPLHIFTIRPVSKEFWVPLHQTRLFDYNPPSIFRPIQIITGKHRWKVSRPTAPRRR